jgi:hypothetical protein
MVFLTKQSANVGHGTKYGFTELIPEAVHDASLS